MIDTPCLPGEKLVQCGMAKNIIFPFPVDDLLSWYRTNGRDLPWRRTTDMYHIWVSEIMLQQTQVNTVIPYYKRFLELFPTIKDLAAATEQEVLKCWEGLGYYSRVRNLHKAAKKVMQQHDGIIPDTVEGFSSLPGIGPYTLAAVLSISRGTALPVVDGNVLRVYTRLYGMGDDITKDAVKKKIRRELETAIPGENPADFNQAVMEIGALVCLPRNPTCTECPFNSKCRALKEGKVTELPFKPKRKQTPLYHVSIGIIFDGKKFFIQKRASEGHLGGLWEFPGGKWEKNETAQQALQRECLEELGRGVDILEALPVVKHVYSHFKIEIHPFICKASDEVTSHEGRESRWISLEQLDDYPFPGANHKIFPYLRAYLNEKPPS